MRFLERHPLVATIFFSVAIILSVFAVETWMTDRIGDVDGKAPITDPPA